MAKKQQEAEERDELGFTPSDYGDMQKLKDREGKLNDTLSDGWDVTSEQITLINSPRHPLHRVAVIMFYDVNFKRLFHMAYSFLSPNSRNRNLIAIVSYEDLMQQLFADLLGGFLKLPHDTEQIRSSIYKCYRYAAVGGLEGVEYVKKYGTLRPVA
ncbi:MAG: hypothetical protein NC131_17895 [Roseburia sp.]|nr:hypothetical protein [Roseburia sp.]